MIGGEGQAVRCFADSRGIPSCKTPPTVKKEPKTTILSAGSAADTAACNAPRGVAWRPATRLLPPGAVAGWLAGQIVSGYGFGLIGNIVVGIVGAFIASMILCGIVLFAAFAVRYVLKRPYWEYVTVLTPAAILLNTPGLDAMTVAEDRVAYTVIATVVGLVLALLIKAVLVRKAPAPEST